MEITNSNFKTIREENPLLVVDFWAEWCGPCKSLALVFEELSKEYEGKITFAKCNAEYADEIADEMHIRNVPTIIFFKNNEEVDKIVGAVSKTILKEKCENLLA